MEEYLPAGHRAQDVAWLLSLYVPGGHEEQAAAPYCNGAFDEGFWKRGREKYPAVQSVQAADPAFAAVPAGQAKHNKNELAPAPAEYEPAGQFTQDGEPPVLREE
jgi:hypothetical protein